MKCRFCGDDAGIRVDEHESCRKAHQASITPEQLAAREAAERAAAGPYVLTMARVFFAVFLALCAYGLLSGIIGAIVKDAEHTERPTTTYEP